MPVNSPSSYYESMLGKWTRCRDCFEGSDAVKAKDTAYLPALDSHVGADGTAQYAAYKKRALFFNATGRTVKGLAGAVFQKDISVTAPPRIEDHLGDVTLAGDPLEQFAAEIMHEDLAVGRYGILLDMASEDAPEKRCYWVWYRAEDIISVRRERRGGDEILTRVVLSETVEESDEDDPFVTKAVPQHRVLELLDGIYTQTIWREESENSGVWVVTETVEPMRRGIKLDFIPFVLSADKKPPLVDLVDVNLSHYMSSADHKHGLHMVALPTPWVAGMMGSGDGEDQPIGPSNVWLLEKEGRAGMLEFTGAGLAAIRQDMQDMQAMMATLGARLLEEQARANETATAVQMRHAGEHATLRAEAGAVEADLTLALQIHGWWMGTEAKPSDVDASVELNKDFMAVQMGPEMLKAWIMALQADEVSFDTFWFNLERGELAMPGRTAEEEQAAIAREGGVVGGEEFDIGGAPV